MAMLNLDLSVSIDDYPQADFPEFYPDFIGEVVEQCTLPVSLGDFRKLRQ